LSDALFQRVNALLESVATHERNPRNADDRRVFDFQRP
jgi:hypothetical protein